MFTDSHCHVFKEYYEDIDKVIQDASQNGVTKLIVAATNIASCKEILELSKNHNNVYICLGIHPDSLNENLDELQELIENNIDKIVAIGEIGLDYYYSKEEKEKQIDVFEYQLNLAFKYNLPVVIHSREATLDTLECLKKYKIKAVLHCFNGSLEIAKEYIKLGFYFGVGGVMTFKNSKIDEIIKEIPLDRIILETDSPYLTPEPFRKYQNEPKYIKTIAEYLANLKNITVEEVSRTTEKNIKDIFDI